MIKNDDLLVRCKNAIDVAYDNVKVKGFLKKHTNESKYDEFVVFQVAQAGQCVVIIPTLFEFYAYSNCETYVFSSKKECHANIVYNHVKYSLNSGHVKSILKMLDSETF